MTQIEMLRDMITQSRSIVFFGGAGVSTESGIPDYRSVDGLYHQKFKYPPETMLSHSFFISHTDEFYDFYRAKMICQTARPNAAHLTLAALEQAGRLSAIITQNIDGLHQAAGSKCVYELHGSVQRNYCMDCGKKFGLDRIVAATGTPRCECGGIIRPDVVLYEEALDDRVMSGALRAIEQADMMIIGGTSLAVYPAAGLVHYYKGNRLVIINRDRTPMDSNADLVIYGNIGEVMSQAITADAE